MWTIAKRVLLFLLVNVLVVVTVSLVLNLLGVQPYLTSQGIDWVSLAIFCFVWGGAGAFISLMLSKTIAKYSMGLKIVDPMTKNPEERELYTMVADLSKRAGLPSVPEVAIFASPELNAFATGYSKSASLVAVSQGLLNKMDKGSIEGVLGHELAHIANGDMVTMTLLQGIVNAFVMFLARMIAFLISSRGQSDNGGNRTYLNPFLVMGIEMVLMFFGMMVVAAFSRYREFRADAGGAQFAGREKMVSALETLERFMQIKDPRLDEQASLSTLKISGSGGFMRLFSTHPPLEERIARLKGFQKK